MNISEPSTQNVAVNGNLSLSCNYDGVPIPTVRWLHNGVELVNDAENVEIINKNKQLILCLSDVGLERGGNYTCEANNSVAEDSVTSHVVTVIVQEKPTTRIVETDSSKGIKFESYYKCI